jgi:molybdenum cofactor cytidylyltransferase
VRTAGIILAAGESRRMGTPKALLDYHGQTFLEHLAGVLGACCDSVVAVTGAHDAQIRAGIHTPVALVHNPQWPSGQLTSLQAGLRAVSSGLDRVLFTLVDHPAIRVETVRAVLASPALFAIPRFQGRRGHPVAFSASLIPEFLALAPSASARDLRERYSDRVAWLDCDDPGIIADIDDPETYRLLVSASSPHECLRS